MHSHLYDFPIQNLSFLRNAADSPETNFENDIPASVLDYSVANCIISVVLT